MLINTMNNRQVCNIVIPNTQLECDYYWARKNFVSIAQSMGLGIGTLSSTYTEQLCNKIFSMTPTKGKDRERADSIDSNGKYVEIKCTQDRNTCASVNQYAKYDYLIWMHIDYSANELIIKKYSKNDVIEGIKKLSKNEQSKKRPTVNLNKLQNACNSSRYKF